MTGKGTFFEEAKMYQKKEPEEPMERIKKFHAHLDECAQCRNHPFGLCPTGARLL